MGDDDYGGEGGLGGGGDGGGVDLSFLAPVDLGALGVWTTSRVGKEHPSPTKPPGRLGQSSAHPRDHSTTWHSNYTVVQRPRSRPGRKETWSPTDSPGVQ